MNRTSLLALSLFLSHPLHSAPATPGEYAASATGGATLAEAVEQARHAARPVDDAEGHWWAQNPANGINARFTPEGLSMGVSVAGGEGDGKRHLHTRWRTVGVGYGERLSPVPSGSVRPGTEGENNRVEIVRPGLVEWFVNGKGGLEHGWTLSERPAGGDGTVPLRVEMALDGDLLAEVVGGGREVILRDTEGTEALRYEKLKVWDAEGRTLASRMVGGGKSLAVEVEDAGAVYPLTIDPVFVQEAYLKASNTGTGDGFGWAVAMDGNTVVVGAPGEDSAATTINGDQSDNSAMNSGAAYVFVRSGISWTQQAYLKASNASGPVGGDIEGDKFGVSVAISGDTVVVGASWEDSAATGVGGNQGDNSAINSGAAYVFVRDGTTWSQQAYLKASNTKAGDQFGCSVAISGNTLVAGALYGDAALSGAAYVFTRSESTWSQQAYLKASNAGITDGFGCSVAIDGDTLVAGATGEDSATTTINGNQSDNSASGAGAAYVFVRSGTVWNQQAYLKASNAGADDFFGRSVAIDGDSIIVGAEEEDSAATKVNGNQNDNSATNSGAAYVFVRNGTSWSQQAYLKASNAGANDWFGWSVAIDGNYAVVGARKESSAATGTNGNQNNDSAADSGAAYFFRRTGTTWTQRDYLKASNTRTGARFGVSVALHGLVIVVGSDGEASPALGIGGNQSGSGAPGAGAVYAFYDKVVLPTLTLQRPKRFPATRIGKKSRSQTLRIVNEGDLGAGGIRVAATGRARRDFLVSQPSKRHGRYIAGGQALTCRVSFRPRAKGVRKATLEVRSYNATTVKAPLSGRGRAKK